MIDTHCHLSDPRLLDQLPAVLERAQKMNVQQMISISTSIGDSIETIEICRDRPGIWCSVGVHPGYVDEEDFDRLPQLRQLQAHPKVIAIGEIGLDYYRGKDNRARQIEFLRWQLSLAREFDRSVVIHSREAVDDCLAILQDYSGLRCVFHCFTGTAVEASRILDAGHMLSFTGVITFKNTQSLRDIVQSTPLDRLMVETDAPYLTPEPMRKQKTNEPGMTSHVLARLAEIKGISIAEADRITTENASRFFGVDFLTPG